MENEHLRPYFFHPKFWPTWLGLALWRLAVMLPYPAMMRLGKWLGLLMLRIGGRRKIIAQRNLELCFPELDPQQREQLLRENFIHYGIAFFEIGIAWWWSNRRFAKLFHIEGLEHLTSLNGQGALLIAVHFTSLEVGASAVTLEYSIDGMYRPHNNLVYDYFQRRGRIKRDAMVQVYTRQDVRGVMKALRAGRVVWYAPDQDYGARLSIFVPFFNIIAATVSATAKLAGAGRAKVIPLSQHRLPGNKGYRVVVHPPLEGYPTGDDEADAIAMNQLVERLIMEQPEAYMWVHRRFKSRPPGEEPLYPAKVGKKRK